MRRTIRAIHTPSHVIERDAVTTFQRLFVVAALAGSLSGVLVTVVHHVATVPLILRAETFEEVASPPSQTGAHADAGHAHDGEHAGAWRPREGFERIAATALTDVATGVGFALLLVALGELCGQRLNWRRGLYWGLGGFAAVTLAPALGLPPELPGTQSAALLDRQVWWVATVVLTGTGLGLMFLVRTPLLAVLGVVLIVLPHLYGAPQPIVHSSLAPAALAREFAIAVILASLVFWIALGVLAGVLEESLSARTAQQGVPT
jgi:cobalt transporter subunit CbtA